MNKPQINHRGIPVKSSVYPENWNPKSDESFNDFAQNIYDALHENSVTLKERMEKFKQEWLKEMSRVHVLSVNSEESIDDLLLEANSLRETPFDSIDLYFDSFGVEKNQEMVVKYTDRSGGTETPKVKYFRTPRLKDSLKECIEFLKT